MRNTYTILFREEGIWHRECSLYPTKKEAEQRRRFILQNFMQEIEAKGKIRHRPYRNDEIEIVEIKEERS